MRYNLKHDFESVYLRASTAHRILHKANSAVVNDPEFKKSVNYMVYRFFSVHRFLFTANGFEWEDVHNIATFFGIMYWGLENKANSRRGQYLLMMRFIAQRLTQFVHWIVKKFNVFELEAIPMREFPVSVEMKHSTQPALYMESLPDEDEELQIQINKRKKQKALFSKLKQQLINNPSQYADKLSYYAVCNSVPQDMRRMARRLCNKYGISYKEWAEEQVATQAMARNCIVKD